MNRTQRITMATGFVVEGAGYAVLGFLVSWWAVLGVFLAAWGKNIGHTVADDIESDNRARIVQAVIDIRRRVSK